MDLIITELLTNYQFQFWNYDAPFNLLAWIAVLSGIVLQSLLLRKSRKFFLFPLVWLSVSLGCEYLYQTIRGLEALGPAIFGILTYLALFGSLLGILFYIIWTKVRHS